MSQTAGMVIAAMIMIVGAVGLASMSIHLASRARRRG